MRFRACIYLLSIALVPRSVEAQAIQSPYEFIETRFSASLLGGWLMTDEGRIDAGPGDAPLLGGRFSLRLTGPALGEAGLAFIPSQRTIYVPSADGSALEAVSDVNALLMTLDAGIRFLLTGQRTWRRTTPYLAATVGVVTDLTSGDALESELPDEQEFRLGPGFAISVGVGGDIFLSERFSVRPEVRDFVWRLSYPPGISGTGRRENEWTNNFSFTIGGAYHF